jgi:hypothetical protein
MKIKIPVALITTLVMLTAANATTSYKTVEINRELHLFEGYLDSLSGGEVVEKIHSIELNQAKWANALKKFPNTITSAESHANGVIIFTNDSFKFEIIFSPRVENSSQIWSCKINDGSIFFKPKQCVSWTKKINITNEESLKTQGRKID